MRARLCSSLVGLCGLATVLGLCESHQLKCLGTFAQVLPNHRRVLGLKGGQGGEDFEGPGLDTQDLRKRAIEKCIEEKLIVSKDHLDTADPEGWRPLHLAVKDERPDHVVLLAQAGANLDSCTARGITGLLIACYAGNLKMAQALLTAGANPNFRDDREGRSALLMAAAGGHTGIVSLLLHHNADPDITDLEHRTPLWAAARFGNKGVVQALLEAGADPNKGGAEKALSVVCKSLDGEDARGRDGDDIARMLTEAGAKPE